MPPRALWLNSRSRPMAATLHASKGYPGGSSGAPALSSRARYGLGMSPLSLSTIVTLSGSHVTCGRGSGHEQPRECSGDSHDGGWRWGAPLGRVAWSRLDARNAGWAPSYSARGCSHVGQAHALPSCRLITRAQGARTLTYSIRQLTKVGRGLRGQGLIPERASQWDGRINSLKRYVLK